MQLEGENLAVVEEQEGVLVARFLTDSLFDPMAVEHVGHQLQTALANGGPNMVVVLDNIKHISSQMLSVFVRLREAALGRDGRICLAAVPEPTQKLLAVAAFDRVFHSFDTVDDAVAALSQ